LFFSFSSRTNTAIYNPIHDSWTTVGSTNIPRTNPMVVNVNGRIFAIGTDNIAYDIPISTEVIEEFFPSNNSW
jgi:hypothetical protein